MNTPLRIPDGATLAALEEYSFSDEAAQLLRAQLADARIVYARKFADVWDTMKRDGAYTLVPFENSSGGIVWPHLDRLCQDDAASIVAEVHLKVRMCVGGISMDAREAEILCSHPKGLEQTTNYFDTHPRLKEKKEFNSTVDAVKFVRDAQNPKLIAVASRRAIEALGLIVLDEDVANLKGDENVTQFFVVHQNGSEALPRPDALRHAAIITPENKAGVLHAITGVIKHANVDLTSMQTRGIGNKKYQFFLEMTRQGTPRQFDLMAQTLEEMDETQVVRWLGSWDAKLEN